MTNWLPKLSSESKLVAVFPVPGTAVVTVDPLVHRSHLEDECEKYDWGGEGKRLGPEDIEEIWRLLR
jgi:hypothetical protein